MMGTDLCLFGVFDGHNGKSAAEFCSGNFSQYLASVSLLTMDLSTSLSQTVCALDKAVSAMNDSGTTACVVAVLGEKVWIANVGDSRAVIFSRSFGARFETADHKGAIHDDGGGLSTSRSLGDARFKAHGLTSTADVYELCVSAGETIVIASDGLWDVLSSAEVGMFISTFKVPEEDANATPRSKAQHLASAITLLAIEQRNSSDNVSVVVVEF
jgi:serine/threonine protein phosphatase PrpC